MQAAVSDRSPKQTPPNPIGKLSLNLTCLRIHFTVSIPSTTQHNSQSDPLLIIDRHLLPSIPISPIIIKFITPRSLLSLFLIHKTIHVQLKSLKTSTPRIIESIQ